MTRDRDPHPQFSFGRDPDLRSSTRGSRRAPRWAVVTLGVAVLLAAFGGYLYVWQPQTLRTVLRGTPFAPPATVTRAYKWQAADGGWHITGDPPPPGVDYEVVTVRSDTNVVPASGFEPPTY